MKYSKLILSSVFILGASASYAAQPIVQSCTKLQIQNIQNAIYNGTIACQLGGCSPISLGTSCKEVYLDFLSPPFPANLSDNSVVQTDPKYGYVCQYNCLYDQSTFDAPLVLVH